MSEECKLNNRDDIEKKINLEVMKDRNFLKKLQADPHQALQEQFGIDIPHHIKLCAHIEEPNSWHFVVRTSAVSSQPLSNSELTNLSAGDCWI